MTTARTFGDAELASHFELVRVGEHPCERFYTMHLSRDRQLALYGEGCGDASLGWLLVVTRGRIGGKAIRMERRFLAFKFALRKYRALCARRRRHGYLMIPTDPQPQHEEHNA